MSLHITAYSPQGIIMASDSRVTLRRYRREDGGLKLMAVETQDDANKLYAVNSHIALSLSGSLDVNGEDMLEYIPRFIERCAGKCVSAEAAAVALLEFFGGGLTAETCFHVAGYEPSSGMPSVCRVLLRERRIERMSLIKPGIIYNGDIMVLRKVLKEQPDAEPLGSLQSMAEFACELIRRTAAEMPLQDGVKTVGGPIDMLQIQPDGIHWLSRK